MANKFGSDENGRFVKHAGVLWMVFEDDFGYEYVETPCCPSCKADLDGELICPSCKKKYQLNKPKREIAEEATRIYHAKQRIDWPVLSLDIPNSNVFDEEQDEHHKVKVYLTQKDGRKIVVAYIIDKEKKNGDKAQIFIDLEKEEVRFDSNDIPPGEIIAKMKVEFPKSEHDVKYKK